MIKLTPKQERFAQFYVELGSPSEAYRHAYDVNPSDDGDWVRVEGGRTLAHPAVSLRIKELRDQLAEEALWKRIDSVQTLADIARGVDSEEVKPSDKVQAVKALNQMMGWEKRVLDHRSTDGSMQPPTVIKIVAATNDDSDNQASA
jgi:phage terminase small subunit